MRIVSTIVCVFFAVPAIACDTPVCLVDPESLQLPQIITFDETRSGHGPGHPVKDLLYLNGAAFGERFAGQSVTAEGNFDRITGQAVAPLTLMPGAKGQNLSVVYFQGNNVLNGYGVAGYPRRHAQGEGAISFLFTENQSALAFQIRGGEKGTTRVTFLARDGRVIAALELPEPGEHAFGFLRATGAADIAGVNVTNNDPQGIALDNIRFGKTPELG